MIELNDFQFDLFVVTNGTLENPDCLTYIFGAINADLLCLATDFCSEKFPFICEMNAASMKLATQSSHGVIFRFSIDEN